MDSGAPGLNGNRAVKRVMMASEHENGSVIIHRQPIVGKLVQAVQRNRVDAWLNGAILVGRS